MGLRSPQPQQLALDFAPAQVRSHGLRDAHTYPQVARRKGASFRVPASQAWGYPSLELRAGNSWPLMGFDCDVPEKVLDALVSNHWGGALGFMLAVSWIDRHPHRRDHQDFVPL